MDVVLRAAAAFGVIFLFTRLLGRRGQGLILVIATVGLLQTALSFVNFRFRSVRKLVDGEPVVVVQNGRYLDKNMKRERITPEDVEEEARLSEIASLSEVQWAVLETSGRISFIKKEH